MRGQHAQSDLADHDPTRAGDPELLTNRSGYRVGQVTLIEGF